MHGRMFIRFGNGRLLLDAARKAEEYVGVYMDGKSTSFLDPDLWHQRCLHYHIANVRFSAGGRGGEEGKRHAGVLLGLRMGKILHFWR